MNTNFFDYQPEYSKFHQYFYLHRVKATLYISPTTPLNAIANKLINLTGSNFVISQCNRKYSDFKTGGVRYSPLDVRTPNSKGELKHWAYLDHVKNIIHIDSRLPEKRIEQFIAFLNDNGIRLLIDHINYSYVEICCRHPHNTFDSVMDALNKINERFKVGKTKLQTEGLSEKEIYSYLIRNIYIDGYCNIKTYKRLDEFKTAQQQFDQEIEPKLEIQIYKPSSLEEAKQRGISVLKAIVSSLNIPTLAMDRKFEISDYTYIPESNKIGQNRKVTLCLNKEQTKTLPNLPDLIINHKHSRNLVYAIWFEAKRAKQIYNWLDVSESTFRRALKRLGNIIERRGDRKTGYFYGIDKTQINNTTQLSNSNNSISRKKNKGKRNRANNKGLMVNKLARVY
ncbi:hypothetical protein A2160_00265 [Candidatus Beckwithbacteria bacterium RBG_13_42_9]|uniref:Uncharacterized protein n=1 Tax=Candidatus Beckwithbacteria bacterium RBG_13_42_9 TaxID=1797457 RepID=A0A1F5E515_9BACT|nr:MAG: hypothetical protein A2160_00265 [Candidatus Beckwithbacteria bacterium RBG_13_42_9]